MNIHVVENFNVVAEKADGLQQQSADALGSESIEGALDGGADPWTAAGALALEGKSPVGNFRDARSDQFSGVPGFFGIGVGVLPSPGQRRGWALRLRPRRVLQRCAWERCAR